MSENGGGMERDRRWAARRAIELDADLMDSDGFSYAAKVTDLSEEGCMVRTLSGLDLVIDSLHEIKITGLEALSAYVVWTADGKAGLTFTTPLNASTIESLVMKSLYARLSRNAVRDKGPDDDLETLGPFPFED